MEAEKVHEEVVIVSDDFRVTVTQSVIDYLDLKPGQRVAWVLFGGSYRLIPLRSVAAMRGRFKGLDISLLREEDDRVC